MKTTTVNLISEQAFITSLRKIKGVKPIKIDTADLAEIAKKLPEHHTQGAWHYLNYEYGDHIPSSAMLDYLFATDAFISYRGWRIAIDFTTSTNGATLRRKYDKLSWIKRQCPELGIDICLVINDMTDLPGQLSQAIRNAY